MWGKKGEILTVSETEKRSKFSIDIITSVFLIIPVIVILRKLTAVQADLYFLANIFFPFIALFLSITIPGPQKSLFFPKLLLVGTVYRLTLSLAFLRLILLVGYKGGAGVGTVIVTLGEISTRGYIIAGLFIFLIILFVNIIITSIYAGQMAGYCNITTPMAVKDGEEEHKKFYEHK